MPANNRVGIVLAGGASRRMQAAGMTGMTGMNAWSDKATLTLAGQTFVERVCLAVAAEVAVSAQRRDRGARFAAWRGAAGGHRRRDGMRSGGSSSYMPNAS